MAKWSLGLTAGVLLLGGAATADAGPFTGTLFYTNYNGGQNVNSVNYSYDDTTHSFSVSGQTNIASAPGADGIIFDSSGKLLVGGQGSGRVYMYDPAAGPGATIIDSGLSNGESYHLTLDPSGQYVYTSAFGGELQRLALGPNTIGDATTINVTGGDGVLTQVAYAPNTGNWFYVNGGPNGGGNLGSIDIGTGVTVRNYSAVAAAHGIVFDQYTNLMTIFGAGRTGTFDASTGLGLKQSGLFTCDFDQGATDGLGHALVAGCGGITLLDYRLSGDITNPDYYTTLYGFAGIDDVAPLTGAGSASPVPEPSTLLLLGSGLAAAVQYRRRRARA